MRNIRTARVGKVRTCISISHSAILHSAILRLGMNFHDIVLKEIEAWHEYAGALKSKVLHEYYCG